MPKMKTHRGAAKRFRLTAKGKIKRSKAFKSHLLTGKTSKRKRSLRRPALVSAADRKRIARLLPYGA
ncbi:MAG: 50S ribosomal protein L35 [Moorellaceae bacterium]